MECLLDPHEAETVWDQISGQALLVRPASPGPLTGEPDQVGRPLRFSLPCTRFTPKLDTLGQSL
jgi:hypothetical protein